ncbi:Oidioi.mRNA.OKI2018_I69.PAR.g11054.t1.cds [Oikopleura dioica]|uniref:Oidioi.mRNA.OKI2018_I69.PAR.g11054.t1.cds n=1 Tax=Oikopleura dioica TaxID=34765 RepID=A0ABN7S137_OIKDI|nr:Oidioi.mRNA.OKI2018_I69.PAR.g11054.t1.cds [Oikopleura dioica]
MSEEGIDSFVVRQSGEESKPIVTPECQKKQRSELLSKLRKERSAQAAKERRANENHEYEKIKKLLPIDEVAANNLDKASAIRITIAFLRLCKFAGSGLTDWNLHFKEPPYDDEQMRQHLCKSTLQTMDGFLMVISTDCKILYLSETVHDHLGLSWTDYPGSAVSELIPHPEDHQELKSLLRGLHNLALKDENTTDYVNIVLRFKSQKEKRNTGLTKGKLAYPTKACQVVGYLRYSEHENARGLVCAVYPLMLTNVRDMPLPPNSFYVLTDDKFVVTKVDRSVSTYIELEQEDMIDVSIYSMIHPDDVDTLIETHNQFLQKSQGATRYYRWLQRNNGYVWCKSTLLLVQKKERELILWINQVISDRPTDPSNGIDLFQRFPADFKTSKNSSQAMSDANLLSIDQGEIFEVEQIQQDTKTETSGYHGPVDPGFETGERVSISPQNKTQVFPKEYSPGSSPERIGDSESIILQEASAESSRNQQGLTSENLQHNIAKSPNLAIVEEDEKNIATYNRPPNSDISSIMRQRNSSSNPHEGHHSSTPIVQLPKMKKRIPSEPFKRPVVIMQPPALRNEPIGTKHHFKDRGDSSQPNEKYRKSEDGTKLPRPKFKHPSNRPRETLRSSLDERNPANQTFEGNESGKYSPQKVRLPQNKRPEQLNIAVHPQDPQVLNQVAAGPGLHFVTPNGQEVSYHTGESGVLPVSTIPFYPSTTHVQRNVEQRQNDKVIYYVPCHRETDEENKPKYVHVPELPIMVNRNGRLEPEVADQNQSPNQQPVQPHTPSAPAVQHVMYLASPSSTQAGYIQHAPSPFIGIPYITQTPQHAQQTAPAVVLVPQPANSHNFNGQHLQLIPGPAPIGN